MSAELAIPDRAGSAVTGTVQLQHGELVVRVRADGYRDATTRPDPPARPADPTTLAGVHSMRYAGSCVGAEAVEHHRTVVWCAAHPVLSWLRWWTR